ncbi:MAG TPA: MFS transporter [Thermoleophilaceae bacterium]|nr:MFS transporter [Thermoleophilaceae bacterium]
MTAALTLLREERSARRFFFAHTQSSLGTGAAYVALLVLAYQKFHSPWAVTLILLADFLPATLIGPILGAAVDRFGRRRCAVIADVLRAAVFIGLGVASSFALIVGLALLAGVGTALFKPAILAGLPSMVSERNLPPATTLYGAVNDLGNTAGPAIAAAVLAVAGASTAMLLNGATFALSALVLSGIDFGGVVRSGRDESGRCPSLLAQAREGLGITAKLPALRSLLIGSTIAMLSAGMMNVAELPLAKFTLHAGNLGYSALVAVAGLGIVAGSLPAMSGGSSQRLKRRYLVGLLAMAAGMIAAGLAPAFIFVAVMFAVTGSANGVASANEQLLVQRSAPEDALGRVFGVKATMISAAFGLAFVSGGALASVAGPRAVFIAGGAGVLCACIWSARALRGEWAEPAPAPVRQAATASV